MTSGRFYTYLVTTTPVSIDLRGCTQALLLNLSETTVVNFREVDTTGTADVPGPVFQVGPMGGGIGGRSTTPLVVPGGELPFVALVASGTAMLTVWKQGVTD